jgi:hypothetical protein
MVWEVHGREASEAYRESVRVGVTTNGAEVAAPGNSEGQR